MEPVIAENRAFWRSNGLPPLGMARLLFASTLMPRESAYGLYEMEAPLLGVSIWLNWPYTAACKLGRLGCMGGIQ